jgi:hypothetical protein
MNIKVLKERIKDKNTQYLLNQDDIYNLANLICNTKYKISILKNNLILGVFSNEPIYIELISILLNKYNLLKTVYINRSSILTALKLYFSEKK